MSGRHFVLTEDRSVIPVSADEWAEWFEVAGERRQVAKTMVPPGTSVSTVFLGLNHSWAEGPPLIFETMAFDEHGDIAAELIVDQRRCSTWDEALDQHERAVADLRAWRTAGRL